MHLSQISCVSSYNNEFEGVSRFCLLDLFGLFIEIGFWDIILSLAT